MWLVFTSVILNVKVLAIEDVFKHRVTNVVFMGMGEPMLNLKSVLDAHRCLNKVTFANSHFLFQHGFVQK